MTEDPGRTKTYNLVGTLTLHCPENGADAQLPIISLSAIPQPDEALPWAAITTTTGNPEVFDYTDAEGSWRAYQFTQDGSITITDGDIERLLVGPGGGGADGYTAGGGGGGGQVDQQVVNLQAGTYPVTIGQPGLAATASLPSGSLGTPTIFAGFAAVSGGIGGRQGHNAGRPTAKFGGRNSGGLADNAASHTVTYPDVNNLGGVGGQGSSAGPDTHVGGGGGGEGAPGGNGVFPDGPKAGEGGTGVFSSITGALREYGSGGGGGGRGLIARGIGSGEAGNGAVRTTPEVPAEDASGYGNGGGGGANPVGPGAGSPGVAVFRIRIGEGGGAENPFDDATLYSSDTEVRDGESVYFRVENVSDEVLAYSHIKWTFQDGGDFQFLDSSHPGGRGKNVRHGWNASHVYMEPGVYNVTCEIICWGFPPVVLERQITVTSAVEYFSGTGRLYAVSPEANYDWLTAAVPAERRFETVEAAITAGSQKGRMILLDPSKDHAFPSYNLDMREFANGGLHIRSGVAGQRANMLEGPAIIVRMSINNPSQKMHVSLRDLNFTGTYDVVNGSPTTGVGGVQANTNDRVRVTVVSCTADHLSSGFNSTNSVGRVTWFDCHVTAWRNYASYIANGEEAGVVGCRFTQAQETNNGPAPYNEDDRPAMPRHGPIRIANPKDFAITKNWFFSRNGWSGGNPAYVGTHQPALRWNASGGILDQARLNFSDNFCEATISCFGSSGSGINTPGFAVFSSNYIVGTANNRSLIMIGHGGTYMHNNVIVLPDVPSEQTSPKLLLNGGESTYNAHEENHLRPVRFSYNTILDLRREEYLHASHASLSPENFLQLFIDHADMNSRFDDFISDENVFHIPNRLQGGVPYTPFAPLDNTLTGLLPLYDGSRQQTTLGVAVPVNTDHATPADTICRFAPLSGSPAIGAGSSEHVPRGDFLGNLRHAVPTLGAIEVE